MDEPSLSDHRFIRFNIIGIPMVTTYNRNRKGTDWGNYTSDLKLNLRHVCREISTIHELENTVNEVTKAIIDSYESNCPVIKKKSNREVPWWNEHLSILRTKVRRLFNRAKGNGDWQSYTRELTLYNSEIRKSKRKSFRDFCENISSESVASRLHKAMARGKVQGVSTLLKPDGTFTQDAEDRASLLLKTHFPGSHIPVHDNLLRNSLRPDWESAKEIITPSRLEWALNSFKPFKSPGVDGIFPALLQKGREDIMPLLIRITRSSLALGYIPTLWRRANIIFIPKAGKKNKSDPKALRPISLTSFMLKTMEKAIALFMEESGLKRIPLHPKQHAYRAGKSTETALYDLTSRLDYCMKNKETAICAFLDIEGAFDNISHLSIIDALSRREIEPSLTNWIRMLLSTRIAETRVGETNIQVQTTKGTPQGGVLSPLLWNLVVDDLIGTLTDRGLFCLGYADDIVIMARGKFEATLSNLIQGGINITKKWCESVGLGINPNKTTIVPFSRKRNLNLEGIRINEVSIPWSSEVKYLGITLDKKLIWNKHVKNIVKKATTALMICRNISGKSWGCSPKIMRWMYLMIVRPIITYGAIVWYHKTNNTGIRQELNKVQRLACICITGAMRTTPTAALQVILNLSPLYLVVNREAERAFFRITQAGLAKPWETPISKLLELPSDKIETRFNLDRKFHTEYSNKKQWISETALGISADSIRWYTDGSKTDNGTGAGIFGPKTKYFESMGTFPSIFQAEIYAIERCAQLNLNRKYNNKKIAILSDSQAAIKALSKPVINSAMVWDCLRKLNELGSNNKVSIYWIPGHTGIEGNERADELAKKGAESPFIGPNPFCGVSHNYIKEEIGKRTLQKRDHYWESQPGLRQSKTFLGSYNSRRTKILLDLGKNKIRMYTGFTTGHCRLNRHLKNMRIQTDNQCRFCQEEEETPLHLVTDCEAVNRRRNRDLGMETPISDLDPQKIFDFIYSLGLDSVL